MLPVFRILFCALLSLTLAGCEDILDPSQDEAIDIIRRLGGEVDPTDPGPTRPVSRINLTGSAMNDEYLKYLHAFPGLVALSLRDTQVSDAGLDWLKQSRTLRRIDLRGTNISAAGLEDLRHAIPGLQILSHLDEIPAEFQLIEISAE